VRGCAHEAKLPASSYSVTPRCRSGTAMGRSSDDRGQWLHQALRQGASVGQFICVAGRCDKVSRVERTSKATTTRMIIALDTPSSGNLTVIGRLYCRPRSCGPHCRSNRFHVHVWPVTVERVGYLRDDPVSGSAQGRRGERDLRCIRAAPRPQARDHQPAHRGVGQFIGAVLHVRRDV